MKLFYRIDREDRNEAVIAVIAETAEEAAQLASQKSSTGQEFSADEFEAAEPREVVYL